jgi:hypothetical protein
MALWTATSCAVTMLLGWTKIDVAHARKQVASGAPRHDPRLHTSRHPGLCGPLLVRGTAMAVTGG